MGIPAPPSGLYLARVVDDIDLFNHPFLAYIRVFINVSHARRIEEEDKIGLEKGFYRSSFKE